MQLISSRTGKGLNTYLTETLGLKPDVDFKRHANGERGGSRYFDVLTDSAIERLTGRAEEVGRASAAERAARLADRDLDRGGR